MGAQPDEQERGRCEHERSYISGRVPKKYWPGCSICGIPQGAGREAERERRKGSPLYQVPGARFASPEAQR